MLDEPQLHTTPGGKEVLITREDPQHYGLQPRDTHDVAFLVSRSPAGSQRIVIRMDRVGFRVLTMIGESPDDYALTYVLAMVDAGQVFGRDPGYVIEFLERPVRGGS